MDEGDARRIRQAAFDRLTAGSSHVLALARDALGEVVHDTEAQWPQPVLIIEAQEGAREPGDVVQ